MLNIKETIMNNPNHQFIYINDTEERNKIIGEIKNDDPSNVIILDEFGSKEYKVHEDCKKELIKNMNRQFLYFTIIYKIVNEALKNECNQNDIDRLIDMINMMYLSNDTKYLKNLSELKNQLYMSKETYKMGIEEYSTLGRIKFDFERLLIPQVDIINVSTKAKSLLNKNSNMIVLLNHEKEISLSATETINDLMFTKINRNFSLKLFTDEEDWKTFTTDTGQVLNPKFDYEELNLNGYSFTKK
jgi:hypothetical protein